MARKSNRYKKNRGSKALSKQQTQNDARLNFIRREMAEHPSRGLTPARLHTILEAAEQGDLKSQHELFLDMEEKDPQIFADLSRRRSASAELEWQIVPPENATPAEKAASVFANEVFASLSVEDLIIDLGDAIGHGWVNLELPWYQREGRWLIGQPEHRPHSWFQLHSEQQDVITLRDMTANGAELWPMGWVQHRHSAKSGYVARMGLHRVLAWPYLFQNYAVGDLAELLEIYGIPARLGKYPRNATDNEKATLLRAVTSLGHSAAGIIPEGMAIDFLEAADGKPDMFESMIAWCERSKAKAILGSTLVSGTGEGTNTNALGKIHERGFDSIVRSDARQFATTIRRDILLPLAMVNFGITEINRAPRFFLDVTETEDLKTMSEALPNLVGMGMQIPTWWAHEKTGIPKPQDNEPVLQMVPEAGDLTLFKAPLKAALSQIKPVVNPVEAYVQQWHNENNDHIQSLLEGVASAIEGAASLEEAQAIIEAAFSELDVQPLAESLGVGLEAAHLAGRFGVEQD